MEEQRVTFTTDAGAALSSALRKVDYDRLFVLTDDTTRRLCLPLLNGVGAMEGAHVMVIPSGDVHKDVRSLVSVWKELSGHGASRRSLLVNLGGGMVTDLGGFAAATFKRGIAFINIPTTLLAMVDASEGGKTGINLGGLKNEVGAFAGAKEVIIDTAFLRSLDSENLRSGFAEMLKHGLLSSRDDWAELVLFDLDKPDFVRLHHLIKKSVAVKRNIVRQDPEEHGLRRALNLGHTAGHALESFAMLSHRPILHGYAVAWGLVCELYLCCKRLGFPHDIMLQTVSFIKENYGVFTFDCKAYEELYNLMTHDKKNTGGKVNFTLLGDIGQIEINQTATKDEIYEMLDFYRETMGC